jgi:hypothetical protein
MVGGTLGAERSVTVRLSVLDLDQRVAIVRAVDDGHDGFPHVLRGTLAAMLADATWDLVVAFDGLEPQRPAVEEVLDQARRWAADVDCAFTVTTLRDVADTPRDP